MQKKFFFLFISTTIIFQIFKLLKEYRIARDKLLWYLK